MNAEATGAYALVEPDDWFVVFHRVSTLPWINALLRGEFKHVSAFAYAPGFKAWVLYDVQWRGTIIRLGDQAAVMATTAGCAVVKFPRRSGEMGWRARFGLSCVSGVKHLLRLKCVAATPCALYRHILRNGGELISDANARHPGPGS